MRHETLSPLSPNSVFVEQRNRNQKSWNGKLRATISLERGASEEVAKAAALADESVQRHIGEGSIRKTIHVPDRMLNLVVTS